MATIVLSAAGMALGGSVGGSFLGLSMATIGRAAGASIGRVIDQQILGAGSDPVETGRVDRFRLTTASEGAPVGQIFGRMRVAGQVVWATQFIESTTTSGGKGVGPSQATTNFSYTVSLAIALCEGEIARVGRVWADGEEIATDTLAMRVYTGSAEQPCDPRMEAVEGVGNVPAYRGLAYVVIEDLALDQFGNRVPQFTFEVMRPSEHDAEAEVADIARQIQGVALIPGTGEYALATSPAYLDKGFGETEAVNVNTVSGGTDFDVSMTALNEELPNCGSALLVVSWFGDDLRCSDCLIKPKVEQTDADAENMPWRVCGVERAGAETVPLQYERPVYGGTPNDAAVVEAIQDMKTRGIETVFYPFILMEQLSGNTLADPYSDASTQPALPWRGRITTSLAPGLAGSPDQTAAAETEVEDFFGDAAVGDFETIEGVINYTGADTWRYRRFILHYAHLCAAAGGVSAFCIGSEMRGLTQIRGANESFPAVEALIQLAVDVRTILGPETKISYAADWSEYHGYQPEGTADKLFHLDALWANENIDFIGIDNYMPLSDWRDGDDHADLEWGSIYNLEYLKSNVAGGEGYDWYYHSEQARDAQIRTDITDGEGEPWVWRYKDLKGWWSNTHHNRIDGVRATHPTEWVPESKPFFFTEFGCAAVDKGSNQPNKFLDPKSSESSLPYYSNGKRDDFLQMQYLRAIIGYFADQSNNPISGLSGAPMVDMTRAHVWAWDTRPFPQFPATESLWSDGENYAKGHWLNGRSVSQTLANVVKEICARSGVTDVDISQLYGLVRGYSIADISTARSALQPLLTAYAVDVSERNGQLVFTNRMNANTVVLDVETLAFDEEAETELTYTRASQAETTGRVQVGYFEADTDYAAAVSEAIHPEEQTLTVSRSEFPLALLRSEAAQIADRWVYEARAARDTVHFALPPSKSELDVGDVVELNDETYRVDSIEEAGLRRVEATKITAEVYDSSDRMDDTATLAPIFGPTPVEMLFLDLPMLDGDAAPQSPYIPATGSPWPGAVAVYSSASESNYILQNLVQSRSIVGQTTTALVPGGIGRWDRQNGLEVKLVTGSLSSAENAAVLTGTNTLAIGDGSEKGWEIIQFREAELQSNGTYRLGSLLRGQHGSDAHMPALWPVGSYVVLLDQRPDQITVPTAYRDVPRYYRYGPSKRPVGDPSFKAVSKTFAGEWWRPYRVCHLSAQESAGDLLVSWIRRTRVEGDSWSSAEVPLGETSELYQIEVRQNGPVIRSETVTTPYWIYPAALQSAELSAGSFDISVAQLSDIYGAGPFQTMTYVQ